ncbi:hypothetical protein DBB29_00685 [Pandoraea cepalis]|uniref:DUF1738 domain-containing protein n=1 Tax=Pandoraea cepalis TaxID=2508294 RepID=A0AAW7MGZ3_9BURK|nr:NADAR domain-containing protein [Pandoraea cepalis]MDN4571998.1 hypothetical protein [Pandoraea cepalis]MDN4576649.1 hypothetical protein [Pandoraea cepalis]
MATDKGYRDALAQTLLGQMAEGQAPWQRPWAERAPLPVNPATGRVFAGANSLYLSAVAEANGFRDPRWMTYAEAAELGWRVRAGQKGVTLESWRRVAGADGEEPRLEPRSFVVYNAAQMANVPPLSHDKVRESPEQVTERLLALMGRAGVNVVHDRVSPFYSVVDDVIRAVPPERAPDKLAYASSLLAELVSWTGGKDRLNREQGESPADPNYSREKLRTEIANYFLGDRLGAPIEPSATGAQAKAWGQLYGESPSLLLSEIASAQRATSFLIEVDRSIRREQEREVDRTVQPVTPFFHASSPFSNWHRAEFEVRDIRFSSVEQYMMFSKAKVFGDHETAQQILQTDDPKEQKALGRQVKGYDESVWASRREAIVSVGVREKFAQNPKLMETLLATKGSRLVEASPNDRVWGGGLAADDPAIMDPERWKGANLLGRILDRVRDRALGLEQSTYRPARALADAKAIRKGRVGTEPGEGDMIVAVPYEDRKRATELGAVWGAKAETWFVPAGMDSAPLSEWSPQPFSAWQAERKQIAAERKVIREASPAISINEIRDAFSKEMRALGLRTDTVCPDTGEIHPVLDGALHRVETDGASAGSRHGWYVCHIDGDVPVGRIGNYRTGQGMRWEHEGAYERLSPEELAAERAAQAARAKQRAEQQLEKHKDAARRLAARWNYLKPEPVDGKQTYLDRKQVKAYGVRFDDDKTIVPLRDIDGKIWSLQTILPQRVALQPGADPADKFLAKSGRLEGCMHVMGKLEPGAIILVGEGYSTMATVHEATSLTSVAAINSGNIKEVVRQIRGKFPTNPIFICADDDRFHAAHLQNAGLTKALEAGAASDVGVIVPRFGDGSRGTDFNDLMADAGLPEVAKQISEGIGVSVKVSQEKVRALIQERKGASVEFETPGANSRHTGEVLGEARHHVAQSTGAASAIVHQKKDLDAVPATGRVATVQYQNGKARVQDRSQQKERAKGVER